MKEISIKLTKKEVEHLIDNFNCAYSTCGIFKDVLLKLRSKVKKKSKEEGEWI